MEAKIEAFQAKLAAQRSIREEQAAAAAAAAGAAEAAAEAAAKTKAAAAAAEAEAAAAAAAAVDQPRGCAAVSSSEQLTGDASSSVQAVPPECERRARVVVCSGVDCMGLGGGAALLEIEELCAEVSSSGGPTHVEAVSGVCTLQCANAPNVNVHDLSSDGRSLAVSNHLRVDSAGRCAEVLAVAAAPPGASSDVVAVDGGGIMMKRAAGLRWNALRQLARCHNTYSLHGFDAAADGPGRATPTRADRLARTAARELLAASLRAEASAARSSEPALARAKRRAERLTARTDALERGVGALDVTPGSK